MAQINNYPPPPGPLAGTENLAGQDTAGVTRRITTAAVAQYAASLMLSGQLPFDLPDEANGDEIPAAGSKLPYLSGGVLKIA